MTRSSNIDRSQWRMKCRERLAQHIKENLRLDVHPEDVRLIPNRDDLYQWEKHPSKKHLFDKHLSKLSIGPLKELYREVGLSFRAVRSLAESDGQSTGLQDLNNEIQRLTTERVQILQYARENHQAYKRELYKLKRKNEQQSNLIVKYRRVMGSFLHDSEKLT
ncbi:hypothetical protein B0T10DRAFT_580967 [Thelonectria olida]|uniref:Uncharacterized protein n=1 Tax=Thelonectria olida TaxID=1576542 RepID=A0A9P9AKM0_9HYPO|nr:hypothetical protein B0T10DRAFT_580967 [Thelonectria olida]